MEHVVHGRDPAGREIQLLLTGTQDLSNLRFSALGIFFDSTGFCRSTTSGKRNVYQKAAFGMSPGISLGSLSSISCVLPSIVPDFWHKVAPNWMCPCGHAHGLLENLTDLQKTDAPSLKSHEVT